MGVSSKSFCLFLTFAISLPFAKIVNFFILGSQLIYSSDLRARRDIKGYVILLPARANNSLLQHFSSSLFKNLPWKKPFLNDLF